MREFEDFESRNKVTEAKHGIWGQRMRAQHDYAFDHLKQTTRIGSIREENYAFNSQQNTIDFFFNAIILIAHGLAIYYFKPFNILEGLSQDKSMKFEMKMANEVD